MKDCVGCGYCCRAARCSLGAMLHGVGGHCPELVWKGDRWRCKSVLAYEAGSLEHESAVEWLAIGLGCCSPLNTDRKDIPSPEEVERRLSWRT